VKHTTLAIALFWEVFGASVHAGLPQKNETVVAAASPVTCENAGANTSESVKSSLGFVASVEVKATIHGAGKNKVCLTSWTLRVRDTNTPLASIEVESREDRPEDNEWSNENSFNVIGWSPDGARLLASTVAAAGDWDETTPVVYDFQRRKWWRVDLAPLFQKLVPHDCLVYFRPVGFTPTGKVAIFVDSFEHDRPCFRASHWTLDYEKQTIQSITDNGRPR
jgi:hypothetical protein